MHLKNHVSLMADYNQWMNLKLYEACSKLTYEQLNENRKAFFGSVIGTLNHLAVADTIWLKRFATALVSYPELDSISQLQTPAELNTILHPDLEALTAYRQHLDNILLSLAEVVTEKDLVQTISYANSRGTEFRLEFFSLLMHLFNHQTHHRGQITTLLSQFGVDVGVTDLLAKIPRQ